MPVDDIRTVEVAKNFNNKFDVDFPEAKPVTSVAPSNHLFIRVAVGSSQDVRGAGSA